MTADRSNGLQAEAWGTLSAVDPRLVPDLLKALAQAGIAARAEPVRGSRGPYLEVRIPSMPQEQIFVDATQVAAAREVLARVTGEDTDAAFEAIIAGWGDPVPVVDWPDAPEAETPKPTPPTVVWRAPERSFDPDSIEEALDTVEADDDAHYVAPPPPRIPRPSWQAALAVLMLVGGIALLVWSAAVDTPDAIWRFAGTGLIVGGVVGLVLRLHDAREVPDDPGDDGARV